MDPLTTDDIVQLASNPTHPCVSLYEPTHRVGPDPRPLTPEDLIRFKNLIGDADERLRGNGLGTTDVKRLLEPAADLLRDSEFWRYQGNGLAVFLAPGFVRHFRVPLRVEALGVVAPTFYVKPLLPMLTGDGAFHILALSQNEVRLLRATREGATVCELPGAPASLADALRFDDPERQLQYHSSSGAVGGRRAAVFHGQGTGIDESKTNVLRFFQQVDRAVVAATRATGGPLVLAAVDALMPIYRDASTHPLLLVEGISGNPELLRPDELHARAWPLVLPHFERQRHEAAERYGALKGSQKASSDLREVVPAAWDGRVDVLFVAVDVRVWGTWAPETRTLVEEPASTGRNEDLLNAAAVRTILNRGTVYTVSRESMPDGAQAAAIFRW